MKTTILTFILLLGFLQVRAQADFMDIPTLEKEFKATVTAENQRLQRRLLLNEAQFIKVAQINTERNERIRQVEAMYHSDADKLTEKLLELELQFDAELEHVLTLNQFKDYLAMHGRQYNPDPENLAEPSRIAATEKPAKATFNDQIHAILKEATSVKIDSSLIARQDTTGFELLSDEEELALNGLKPMNATLKEMLADTTENQKTVAKTSQKPEVQLEIQPENAALESEENEVEKQPEVSTEIAAETVAESAPKPETSVAETIAGTLEPEFMEEKPVAVSKEIVSGECLTCYEVPATDSLKTTGKAIALKGKKKAPASPKLAEEWAEPTDPFSEVGLDLKPTESKTETSETETENNLGNDPVNENSLALPANEIKKLRQSLENGTENNSKTESGETDEPALNELLPLNKSLAEEMEP